MEALGDKLQRRRNDNHQGERKSRRHGKRGYFFTLDGLLAASILLSALILFTSYGEIQAPVIQLNFAASDLLNALETVKFSELNSTGQALLGTLDIEQNQSLLAVIGDAWARDNITVAQNIFDFFVDSKVPSGYGVGFWLDGEQISARTSPAPNTRASARSILSGLTKAQPTHGFISRASAESLTTQKTRIYSISAEGAGWDGSSGNPGRAIITKWVNLSGTINNASLAVSLHLSDTDTNWTVISINNGTSAACNFSRNSISHSGDGYYQIIDVKNCLTQGVNKIRLDLRNSGYNGHVHPGMLLRVDYSESAVLPTYTSVVSERIYFDNITSVAGSSGNTGVWQVVPFHIPPGSTNISVYMQIAAKGVTNYGGSNQFSSWSGTKRERDYDYVLFINDDSPYASSSSPPVNPQYNYSPATMAPRLVNGTNVVTVYFNNYGDDNWGSSAVSIYSEPFTNPRNSSFIELNYTSTATLPYGQVEIAQIRQATPPETYSKIVNFTYPSGSTMSSVYGHIAQRFSYTVTVEADTYTSPTTDVFNSPSSRGVPTDIYIPTTTLSASPSATNFVEFTDNNNNDIIANTSVEYRFYLPGFVGFGDIFNTSAEAVADAQSRLTSLLAGYADLDSINFETENITDVPTLWGPAIAEVRIWR